MRAHFFLVTSSHKIPSRIMQHSARESRDGLGGFVIRWQVAERSTHHFAYLKAIAPADHERVRVGPEQTAPEELVPKTLRVVILGHERDDALLRRAVDLHALVVAPRDQVLTPLDAPDQTLAFVQYVRLAPAHKAAFHQN